MKAGWITLHYFNQLFKCFPPLPSWWLRTRPGPNNDTRLKNALNSGEKLNPLLLIGPQVWKDVCVKPTSVGSALVRTAASSDLMSPPPLWPRTSSCEEEWVWPNKCRKNSVAFVPDCDFKECQKLINILELGVCRGGGRRAALHWASALFTLWGKQVRPHEGEFHFKNSI